MKRLFFALFVFQSCFFGWVPLVGDSIVTTPEEIKKNDEERELLTLDEQIQSLTDLRDYYASKAARYATRADRYKIRGGKENLELARSLSIEANDYRNIVKHLDIELAKLEKQRSALRK